MASPSAVTRRIPRLGVLLHAHLGQRAPLGRRRRRHGPRGLGRPLGHLLPPPYERRRYRVRRNLF